MNRFLLVFFVIILLFEVEGCITTVVRVETNPPGSLVHYDYEPKGDTPAEFNVDWAGTHKLTLDHPEYGRRIEYINIKPPAYMWFPLDLFVTILPFNVTNEHTFSFDMTTATSLDTEKENDESEGS